MKALIGVLLILAGVFLGVYVGLWVCFIGGIVGIIEQIQTPPVDALVVAWSIAKIWGAGFVGFMLGLVFVGGGLAVLADD